MSFPNAAKGVKKIFSAQLLALIAGIATVVGFAFALVAVVADKAESETGAGLSLIATAILMIGAAVLIMIAFIMQIVGIGQAGKDEPSFKAAMVCLILGIISSIVGSIFVANQNGTGYSICETVTKLMSLFVTIFIISGIIKLADRLNNGAVSVKGSFLLKLITAIYALLIIASVIATVMIGSAPIDESALSDPAAKGPIITICVIYIIVGVLQIVQYFLFLSLLSKANKMLATE